MEAVLNPFDSKILGKNFIDILNFSQEKNFEEFEYNYIRDYNPFYVSVKVPIENVADIHFLESKGFNYIELQIRETLKLKKLFDHISFFPYKIEPVTTESDLLAVLAIAEDTFRHDRYTSDPSLPKNFSGDRYKLLVRKSFEKNDEFIFKFYNTRTSEILGFKTHKVISDNEAIMFLGGIAEKYKKSPLPAINSYLELNELFSKGIRKVTTHISGGNYGVLNLELKEFGYKVVQSFIILRKVYS